MVGQLSDNLYRFIPFRQADIVRMCLQENQLRGQEEDFRQLCHMLGSVFPRAASVMTNLLRVSNLSSY
jgi:hypothetical protein